MNIGEVLARAWDIIWKNKILWVFGLLASLAGGSGGNNFRYNFESRGGTGIGNLAANVPNWLWGLFILLGLVLIVVFVILATLGRAGLVRGAWLADSGETPLSFGQLFRSSQAYFWRVILLGILVLGVSLTLILVLAIPTVLTLGIALVCLWPLICLLVPFFILLTVIVELAIVAIVGEDLGVIDSLRRAWEIFRANLALIIAVGVVVAIVSAVIGFLAGLPVIATLAPAFLLFSAGNGHLGNGAAIVGGLIVFLLYLPILLLVQSIVTAYVETTWTVAFRRLTGRTAGSGSVPAEAAPAETAPIL